MSDLRDTTSPIARFIQGLLASVEGAGLEGVELTVVHKVVQDLADDLADALAHRAALAQLKEGDEG